MNTAERLEGYYPFSQGVIETVANFADHQKDFDSYQAFFDSLGIGETIKWQAEGYLPVEILDIRPKEHDPREAMFVRLPMANPLDPNQIFQVATLAGTNPTKRLIAIGNPSRGSYGTGLLNREQRKAVAHDDLRPLVEPSHLYAAKQKIETGTEVGYSEGALLAPASAAMTSYAVNRLISIEPVVQKRSLPKLGKDFMSTAKELKGYVQASDTPIFEEARKDSVSGLTYNLGVLRLTNLAAARTLAHGKFEQQMGQALDQQADMIASVIWGSESELALDGVVREIIHSLRGNHGHNRVGGICLPGQKHALANDIHLQAAVVLESLRAA